MSAVPIIGFMVLALVAIAFALVPLLRGKDKKKSTLLLAAIALFVLGVGSVTYWMVGRPQLAQREARGLDTNEPSALVPYLIKRVRQYPDDIRAWRYLGQAYMAARDPRNAAKALGRAIALQGKGDAELNADYGEALVIANRGAVPPEAEEAFNSALAVDPSNAPARFYLGDARRAKGDAAGAMTLTCRAMTGQSGSNGEDASCNIYRAENGFAMPDTPWIPQTRPTDLEADRDDIGVWVQVAFDSLVGDLFDLGSTISDYAVFQIEPRV